MTDDEQLYLKATQKVDNGKQDPALWAKAMALVEGDANKAKYRYITLQVEKWGKEGHLQAIKPIVSSDNLQLVA